MIPTTLRSCAAEHEREQRAHAGRRQRGKNGDGMNEALIQNAKNDVDSNQRGKNQQCFVGERIVERRRGSLEVGLQAGREVKVLGHFFDVGDRGSQRGIRAQD